MPRRMKMPLDLTELVAMASLNRSSTAVWMDTSVAVSSGVTATTAGKSSSNGRSPSATTCPLV
ncbi:MAG: hypothetical protein BWX84_00199 [Verrucomicrobia bacterium ADurb.Bin118]|nr:MAG: hypothetical protein BWX84_00199 [Verrucomicrobia bacterium ADurb.Bin118]